MKRLYALALTCAVGTVAFAQTYTFTNCNATGRVGPTQAQANTAYTSTTLNGLVTVVDSGVQQWTPPIGGTYSITISGASGGTTQAGPGGRGVVIYTEVNLSSSTTYNVVVGQQGQWNGITNTFRNGGSGGGGSFVFTGTKGGTGLIVAAGGGGGAIATTNNAVTSNDPDANYHTRGDTILDWTNNMAAGGINGNGGWFSDRPILSGGPGAGWFSDADNTYAGSNAYIGGDRFQGGIPNQNGRDGGFGGGGASGDNNTYNANFSGGGGGYSGGGAGHNGGSSDGQCGGGGGSYITGANQANQGWNTGHGSVVFTLLCTPLSGSQTLSICHGDTVWVGNNGHASTGTFVDTIPGSTCDSIVTTNLTVSAPINMNVTNVPFPPQLTSGETGATYQWLDCDNNMAAIPGATAQTYNPTTNGNYAVAVTVGSCTDTSACSGVTTVGMAELMAELNFNVFPNPANDRITMSIKQGVQLTQVKIMDITGKVVVQEEGARLPNTLDVSSISSGTYILQVRTSTNVELTQQLVIN